MTEDEAKELVITRETALRDNARVEFGIGAVKLIIEEFADSPYIDQANYAQTLNELTDLFYYIKSETDDKISDRELVDKLKYLYENTCGGSLELLMSRDTEQLIRQINGYSERAAEKHVYRPLSEYFSQDSVLYDADFDDDEDDFDDDISSIDEQGFKVIDLNEDDEGIDENEYTSPAIVLRTTTLILSITTAYQIITRTTTPTTSHSALTRIIKLRDQTVKTDAIALES